MTQFQPGGDATEQVQAQNEKPASPHLELQLVHPGLGEFRVPFIKSEIDLSKVVDSLFSFQGRWVARLDNDRVTLSNETGDLQHVLAPGDSVELGENMVWLVDARQPPVATLECLSEPFQGRAWHIRTQQTFLGRAGKRLNHIELSHPTISRTHATLSPDRHGHVFLLNETLQTGTTVNGEGMEKGSRMRLNHGDLLAFGDLLFRLSSSRGESEEAGLLSVQTLGTLAVSLGGKKDLEIAVKQKKARWLLAMLAAEWGRALSVETIIDRLWPEVVVLRGRKNLSALLAHLQTALELDNETFNDLIIRTTSTLQLNPNRLGQHDFCEVERLTEGGKALTSEVALERLVGLYQGHFLPSCYDDWAEVLRQRLEANLMETLYVTAHQAMESGRPALAEKACVKLLEMDPDDEEATTLLLALKNSSSG